MLALNLAVFGPIFFAPNSVYAQHGFSCIDLSMSGVTYSWLILRDKVI